MLTTHQADLVRVVIPSPPEGIVVVELEPSPLRAAPAVLVDEPALVAIALSHDAPHRRGHISRRRSGIGLLDGLSRVLRHRVALRLEPFELLGHRSLDDGREVLSHERPQALELVAKLSARRELHSIALRPERLDHRRGSRRRRTGACGSLNSFRKEFDGRGWRRQWETNGELSYDRRNVGLGRKPGHELLDLTLGLVRRPGQYLLAILVREMGREERDAAQVQPAVPEHGEEHGVLARGAGDGDTKVRLRLRKVQDLDAVKEHGRASFPGVQAAMVDLPDVRDEGGLDPSRLLGELEQTVEELVIRH